MGQSPVYLAIDLGAESGRAMTATCMDERLELRELQRFANTPVRTPDGLHWDILRLWAEIKSALHAAVRLQGATLAGVGIDTWGVDFGLLDRQGTLVGNPVHYRDSRTDGMLEQACRRVPRERIFELTGIQFMQINSLYQLLSLVLAESPALAVADTFLTIPDLFNYWLCDRKVCEFTNATTTQCFDPRQGTWSAELLAKMGIPIHIFPSVVQPGTVLGSLRPELVEEFQGDLPVIAPACHDTGSAVTAVPASGDRFAWISSGTWSIVGTEADHAIVNDRALQSNFTNEGGVCGTWRFSKNVMGLWLVQECRRTWAHAGRDYTYDELTQLAAQAEPFAAILDPDRSEFFKPGDMPARIESYCLRTDQKVPRTHGATVRCVLESLALKYRWVIERLDEMLGYRLDPIHVIGGGSQNRLLNQWTADATGRTVIAGPVEATAIGNALMQAVALGLPLAQGRAFVRNSFDLPVFEPHPLSEWDTAFRALCNLMSETGS